MIAKYTPAAIDLLPGDEFPPVEGLTRTVDGWYASVKGFQHKRGSTILATYLLKDMARLALLAGAFINGSTPFAFYVEEFRMAAVASTMTNVTLDGDVYTFQHGPEGFPKTISQLEAELAELQSAEMAQKIARVNAFAKSNGGADMSGMIGIPVTIDFAANNPIQLGE